MSAGAVVWITGLPASGKSTLAERFAGALRAKGRACAVLDGDAVREALGRPAGAGEAERDAFYAALARLGALLARQGLVAIVAATAPRRAHRDGARRLAPRFVEVFVDASPDVCAERDPKGLWAAARRGELAGLPGAGVTYEPPDAPDVIASGGCDEAAVRAMGARVGWPVLMERQ